MKFARWTCGAHLIATAAVLGFTGWNGSVLAMLGLPLLVWIWRIAPNRHIAFLSLLAYYLMADRGLLRGAAVFFADPFKPSLLAGLAIWIVPSVLLALTWAILWGRRYFPGRLAATLLLISVPPIGIIGWASPLTAAGAWFPGTGWWGLYAFLSLLILLVSASPWKWPGVGFLTCLAVVVNASYTAPSPIEWSGINTNFPAPTNEAGEYARMRQLLAVADRALMEAGVGSILVFPEAVGGNWEVNRPYWERLGEVARRKDVTLLIGGQKTISGSTQYVNGLFGVGLSNGVVIPGRMPVPISMWIPFSDKGAIATWGHPGVTQIHGQAAAHLVCYEQLLIWPMLRSMLEEPQVLIGVANDWWAAGTIIPAIQRQVVDAWGRLFALPVVFAMNE